MTDRYFVFVREGDEMMIVGKRIGYALLTEARAEAIRHVDDALPNNSVLVLKQVDRAYLDDGGSYLESESE